MVKDAGATSTFLTFPKRSHGWGDRMNVQLIRTAVSLHPSVKSKVTALPGGAAEGDAYISPVDGKIHVWVDAYAIDNIGTIEPADWWAFTPSTGYLVYVEDEQSFYIWAGAWIFCWQVGAAHREVQRELTFYNPYRIRKSSTIFYYVAGTEFTIPAGAAGSGASLEIASSVAIVFSIQHNGATVGTISFDAASTSGVVTIASEVVVHPSIDENEFTPAHSLRIVSPAETYEAEGLAVSIKGMIRSIDQ